MQSLSVYEMSRLDQQSWDLFMLQVSSSRASSPHSLRLFDLLSKHPTFRAGC